MKQPSFLFLAAALALGLAPTVTRAGDKAIIFDGGLRTMSNSPDTEKAIFGDDPGIGFGLGFSYDHGSRWRFGIEARRINRDGERAFAADRNSEAFRLGHPLTLRLTEGLASVAYRFGKMGPVSPYIGIGGGVVSWDEESNTAGLIEQADGTAGLFEGRLGVESQKGAFRFGVEAGMTFARNAIGAGGISQVYEETDLGGFFVVGKIAFTIK
jgi:opacity protein-like surface antigen